MKRKSNKDKKKGKTILIVDDEPIICVSLSDTLKDKGYSVVSTGDGKKGMEEYKRNDPDLILLDIKMPRMDGLEFLEKLRKVDKLTPVIILTGFSSLQEDYRILYADEILVKADSDMEDKLFQKIEKLLYINHENSEAYRLRNLTFALIEENKHLKENLDNPSENKTNKITVKDLKQYRETCGAIAHNLKGEFLNLSNSINRFREIVNISPEIREEFEIIERSIEYSQIHLLRLLDCLDIGIGKPRVEPVDIQELFKKTEKLARPRLPSSIRFKTTFDYNIKNRMVSVNNEQLIGVILEFIHNAVDVLREKGGTIELKLEEKDSEIAISVKDDGPGIPVEIRKKLLKGQVPSRSGLGLGIFLSNKVIKALGGKLNFQTFSKEGTTFTILLPVILDKKDT